MTEEESITITIENSVVYDGSPASVERIMTLLGRTAGINNSPEGLYLNGEVVKKGQAVVLVKGGGGGGGDDFMIIRNKKSPA